MDLHRLDRLSQTLADPTHQSRRGILAALGAALVGAIVGADLDDVDASRKRRRRPNHTKRHHPGQHAKQRTKQHQSGARKQQHAAIRLKHGKKHKKRGDGHDGGTDTPPPTDPPACVPDCAARNPCGDDGCHGSCGECTGAETCQEGRCVCQPDCTGKRCGGDGCGGSCGECAGSATCDHGTCRCQPQCDGKTCGPDGCGGSCGTCGAQELCDGGSCLCAPDCGSKVCGGDGCGGSCGECRAQGVATCGTTGACRGGACDLYASGIPCQAAVCTSETTLQPECTCDGQGGCDCPGPITCPKNLDCHNGACLTRCRTNDDCANDNVCNAAIGQCGPVFTCDCSTFNACSGHGLCTEACTCLCDEGWTGIACDEPMIPASTCADYTTCEECKNNIRDGCNWCSATLDGTPGPVCTSSGNCGSEIDVCA